MRNPLLGQRCRAGSIRQTGASHLHECQVARVRPSKAGRMSVVLPWCRHRSQNLEWWPSRSGRQHAPSSSPLRQPATRNGATIVDVEVAFKARRRLAASVANAEAAAFMTNASIWPCSSRIVSTARATSIDYPASATKAREPLPILRTAAAIPDDAILFFIIANSDPPVRLFCEIKSNISIRGGEGV